MSLNEFENNKNLDAVDLNDNFDFLDTKMDNLPRWEVISSGSLPTDSSSLVIDNIDSNYEQFKILFKRFRPSTSSWALRLRFNDSSSDYMSLRIRLRDDFTSRVDKYTDYISMGYYSNRGAVTINIDDFTGQITQVDGMGFNSYLDTFYNFSGYWNNTNKITKINIYDENSNNFNEGVYVIYGYKKQE